MTQARTARMVWLDWMKVGATLAVIYGHFFAAGDIYMYVFNLQSFCVVSGFLYKRAAGWGVFLKATFWSLLVPTVVLSTLMQLEAYLRGMAIGQPYDISWPWFFKWLLLGNRWCMGPCWYFYSLMVMRLIMQLLPDRRWVHVLLFVAASAAAVVLQQRGIEYSNANVNVLVCMPFFLIGLFLKPLKSVLHAPHPVWAELLLLAVSAALVVLCAHCNGYVWMYLNGIGSNYALYLLGGMSGTLMLYALGCLLSRWPHRQTVASLSSGTMLVVGLHIVIVRRLMNLPHRLWPEDLFFAVMILLFFIPVVRLAERYCPLLLGRYKGRSGRKDG